MVGSHIEAHLFGSMEEDEKCNFDHTLIVVVVLEKSIQTRARMLS